MQAIPVKVKNITLYAYFSPIEPLTEVVLSGASGTYAVGTLMMSSFYNLDITNEGKQENPLAVHSKYYAVGETEDGSKFTTPWMYCLDNSKQPKFGRTITYGPTNTAETLGVSGSDASGYITLGALTDITVSQLFPGHATGQTTLIENGTGNIIATKYGTPHLMGVQVDHGDVVTPFSPDMKNIIISGKTEKGEVFSQTGYTAVSNGKPAIFLKEFF